jgi:hypothetical protein
MFLHLCQCNTRLFDKLFGEGIWISLFIKDGSDISIDNHFDTDTAGEIGTEKASILDANAVGSCLNNGVLFRMGASTELMPFTGGNLILFP